MGSSGGWVCTWDTQGDQEIYSRARKVSKFGDLAQYQAEVYQ